MNFPRNVLAISSSHTPHDSPNPVGFFEKGPEKFMTFNCLCSIGQKLPESLVKTILWPSWEVENLLQTSSKSPFSLWSWTLREFVGGNQICKAIKGSLWRSFHYKSLCVRIIFEGVAWYLRLDLVTENYSDILVTCNEYVSFSANMCHSKSSCHFKKR